MSGLMGEFNEINVAMSTNFDSKRCREADLDTKLDMLADELGETDASSTTMPSFADVGTISLE